MSKYEFYFEVEYPSVQANFVGARPRAIIVLHSSKDPNLDEPKKVYVPKAVGKRMALFLKGDIEPPQNTKEFFQELDRIRYMCIQDRVEDMINRRDYSSKELHDKLKADGYPEELIQEIIERKCESGLINDARYADIFIRSKLYAGWGQLKIKHELARKGIDISTVSGWPDEYLKDNSEEDRAYELASRRRISGKDPFAKLVRFLCTRGFSTSVAIKVSKRILQELEDVDAE